MRERGSVKSARSVKPCPPRASTVIEEEAGGNLSLSGYRGSIRNDT